MVVVVSVCSKVFSTEDMYELLERLMFRMSLDLTKGFIPWFQFSGYTVEFYDVDESNFYIFII